MKKSAPSPKNTPPKVEELSLAEKQKRYATTTCIKPSLFFGGRGRDSRFRSIEDGENRTLLDASAAVSTKNIGYGEKRIVKCIREFLSKEKDPTGYPHHDMQNEYALNFACKLAETVPLKGKKQVVFGNSGAEAIEAALKLTFCARAKKHNRNRTDFLSCFGSFHGRTAGALSLSCSKPAGRDYLPTNALPVQRIYFPARHNYFTYNNQGIIKYVGRSPDEHFEKFKEDCRTREIDLESINAFIFEPIQGEGGVNVASEEALRDFVQFLKANNVFIIVDEIQTGFGRTGKMWAFEHFNIDPDIVLTSKSLAYGLPMSAAVYLEELGWNKKGQHSSTFAGGPLISAVASETLRIMKEDNLPQRAKDLGDRVLGPRLRTIAAEHEDVVHNVRGLGLMHGIEFWNPRTWKEAPNFRNKVIEEGRKRGVLLLDAGASAIRLTPPLTITNGEDGTPKHLKTILDVLEESIIATKRKSTRID